MVTAPFKLFQRHRDAALVSTSRFAVGLVVPGNGCVTPSPSGSAPTPRHLERGLGPQALRRRG